MPDLGHVAVGLYAARVRGGRPPARGRALRAGLALSALSLLPDGDLIGRLFGVPDASILGHRGFMHSLAAALVAAFAVWLWRRREAPRDALWAFAVMASHGALDMLDRGRLGVAYLWPLTGKRFFWPAPLRFLPGPPPGEHWLSWAGAASVGLGVLPFLPLFWLALRPEREKPLEPALERQSA